MFYKVLFVGGAIFYLFVDYLFCSAQLSRRPVLRLSLPLTWPSTLNCQLAALRSCDIRRPLVRTLSSQQRCAINEIRKSEKFLESALSVSFNEPKQANTSFFCVYRMQRLTPKWTKLREATPEGSTSSSSAVTPPSCFAPFTHSR